MLSSTLLCRTIDCQLFRTIDCESTIHPDVPKDKRNVAKGGNLPSHGSRGHCTSMSSFVCDSVARECLWACNQSNNGMGKQCDVHLSLLNATTWLLLHPDMLYKTTSPYFLLNTYTPLLCRSGVTILRTSSDAIHARCIRKAGNKGIGSPCHMFFPSSVCTHSGTCCTEQSTTTEHCCAQFILPCWQSTKTAVVHIDSALMVQYLGLGSW